MKVLHTSDWHLGRNLYGRQRYKEFEQFLRWLKNTIEEEKIDVLIVAGDVFDNGTPSNRALKLYYNFLYEITSSCCKNVIVIAGNHDSPSLLNAPKDIFRFINVHVIGKIEDCLEDEVLVLKDSTGNPAIIVGAVPYLRDRDVRKCSPGETIDDKNRNLIGGIKTHYHDICEIVESKRQALDYSIPFVATGHLFTVGGKTVDGDGVRELYVGSLVHVGAEAFPETIDYLALGHLHVPQKVGGDEHRRFSGSPIPMNFGESKQQKLVVKVEFESRTPSISEIKIPAFQKLITVSGDLGVITETISDLKKENSNAWLEVVFTGDESVGNLHSAVNDMIENSNMEVLKIKNAKKYNYVMQQTNPEEGLDDLSTEDVFERCLDANNIPPEQRIELINSYKLILQELNESVEVN